MNVKIAIAAALGGAVILGATIAGWSAAKPGDEAKTETASESASRAGDVFSNLEENEIRGIVREYLLDHPEVIIEAVNAYSERERIAQEENTRISARENLQALVNGSNAYIAGADVSKAKVAVVELFDYHCTYCKRAAGMVKELTASDSDVKVVFRELPILRKESEYAAEMALAAREQGKFLEFHFALMDANGLLTPEHINDIAKKVGLNVAALEKARDTKKVANAIRENHRLADEMATDGTPTFVIAALDGSYIEVLQGFRAEVLREKINEAKAAANK